MAKSKSNAAAAKNKGQSIKKRDDVFLQALPFVRDTREETFREDKGMHWWHVSNTNYWHQDLSIGEAFCDKAAALHNIDAVLVREALGAALGAMVNKGYCGGIEQGFVNRLVHYASIGMAASGAKLTGPLMSATV